MVYLSLSESINFAQVWQSQIPFTILDLVSVDIDWS